MRNDDVLPYLYVYKITFPNGEIYVSADWGRKALNIVSYFGSFKVSIERILEAQKKHLKAKYSQLPKKFGTKLSTKRLYTSDKKNVSLFGR